MHKKQNAVLSLILCSFWFTALVAGSPPDASVLLAAETIRAEDLRSALSFLASDDMQGREINTLFNNITSSYLTHRFELLGLVQVLDDVYHQSFLLVRVELSQAHLMSLRR